jgi:hypothetical protein
MGLMQKLITACVPKKWAAAMEAESRAWVMRCSCGHETSVWEMGGIRFKAAGRPWRWGKCARCCRWMWGRLYKIEGEKIESQSAPGDS